MLPRPMVRTASLFNLCFQLAVPAVNSSCRHVGQCSAHAGGFSVFAGVGERTREGNDLYKEMTESVSASLNLATCMQRCFLVILQSACQYQQQRAFANSFYCVQGVIKLGEKASESKCTLVYGQMNEPPGARARVALTGEHKHCLPQGLPVFQAKMYCMTYDIALHPSVFQSKM